MVLKCSKCQYGKTELPKLIRNVLIPTFSLLYIMALVSWVVYAVYYKYQWECLTFRADYPPSILQELFYFSNWSMWFSAAIFFGWVRKSLVETYSYSQPFNVMCVVALPHIITVFICYIYYDALYDADEYVNKEACYTLRKSAVSKEITSNQAVVDTMLITGVINNLTVHYFSAPLMFVLLWCGEISYSVDKIWKLYSTVFTIILGIVIGLCQEFVSPIYDGDVWFYVGMMILINFLIHCILFGINQYMNRQCTQVEENIVDKVECKINTSVEEGGASIQGMQH